MQRSDHPPIPHSDYRPLRGCLATAPVWGAPSTWLAGPYGGNMDIVEVRPENTVCSIGYYALGTVAATVALRFAQEGAQ